VKLIVVGLSLSSSWGNGHATTYRALLRAMAARGHDITFYEWDAPWYGGDRRDLPDPDFCRLELYPDWESVRERVIGEARDADATLVGSYVKDGTRVIDDLASAGTDPLFFYDIDTPVTVAKLRRGETEYLRPDQVPLFTRYFSFTGGPFLDQVLERELGARDARQLACSVDADHYRPVPADREIRSALAYMGTYSEDRAPGLDRLLLQPAARMPGTRFVVGGPNYPDVDDWPRNVLHIDHVPPARHATFYASADWQLNLTRANMREAGWSPSVRLFEAAACGAPLLSDWWPGLDELFEPGRQILIPENADEVIEALRMHPDDRTAIGMAAREKVLAEHTKERRAEQLEAWLQEPVRTSTPA
jgi:spore maturation protein CgeB